MNEKKTSILVVCKANYCRSPVAMVLLRKYLKPSFDVRSAGIIDFFENSMDKRSQEYLNDRGLKNILHIPKKVNFGSLKKFDLVLSIDTEIYSFLKSYAHPEKHFLFNANDLSSNVLDPINFKDKGDYDQCMMTIDHHCLMWSKKLNDLK